MACCARQHSGLKDPSSEPSNSQRYRDYDQVRQQAQDGSAASSKHSYLNRDACNGSVERHDVEICLQEMGTAEVATETLSDLKIEPACNAAMGPQFACSSGQTWTMA